MRKFTVLIITIMSLTLAHASKEVILTEKYILNQIALNPPSVQQIESSFLKIKQERAMKKDKLSFRLDGEGSVYESKERLLNAFDGVTQNANAYSLGIVKPTRYGVNVGLKAFANKNSNSFIEDSTTTGVGFNLSMDIFQDFLGRRTNNDLKKSELSVKRARLEKKASLKTFETTLRKLYWALVANNEQKLLLTNLVELSDKQFKESLRRNKSGVADSGEVARYRSQWTTRKASLLSLQYRRGEILKTLKELLPELNGKDILIGPYSVDGTVAEVLACSTTIRSFKTSPFQFTPYDEIIDLFKDEQEFENKVIETYDDPEIKLVGEYLAVGRDYSFEDARTNLDEEARNRTSLGLSFSIPFGGTKKTTKEVSRKLAKNYYQAQTRGNLSKINAFHTETAEIIGVLKDVVKNQKETNFYLGKSIKVSQKKYKQARISVQELILEQDTLLQSKLNEIDTNLTIINTLMDYFSIYADTPCKLNRI